MGKATRALFGRKKGQCATRELHHGSEDEAKILLKHQSKISPTTMAELHRRTGRSRFKGSICMNCIHSVEGKVLKSFGYLPAETVQQTVNDFPNTPISDIDIEIDSDIENAPTNVEPLDIEPGDAFFNYAHVGIAHADPVHTVYVGPVETGSTHADPVHTVYAGPVETGSTHADPVHTVYAGPVETGSTHADPVHTVYAGPVETGPTPADPMNDKRVNPGAVYRVPTHPGAVHPVPTHPGAVHPLPTHPGAVHPVPTHPGAVHPLPTHPGAVHPLPTHPGAVHPLPTHPAAVHPLPTHPAAVHPLPTHPGAVHPLPTHPAAVHPVSTHPGAVNTGPVLAAAVNIRPMHTFPEDTGNTAGPVIVLSLGHLRRDLASLSVEMRALIAFELAAVERQYIRSDVLALTKGDFRNIDSLNDMCKAEYLDSRNRVLTHFLTGLWDGTGSDMRKPTSKSADLPVALHKQSDIYKLAKAVEACMGLTMPVAVLPFHFREIVLLYSHTRSRTALSLLSATAPHGCYQTVRNWLDKLAETGNGVKLPKSKGDTLCVFDNNQVLLRRWNICADNKATCSVITMVMFLDIESEGTLQFQEEFKPRNWMWTNLDSVKLAGLREGHLNLVHQDNRYRKHFHPWLSDIIQQVASEQTVMAGKCVDDVDQQVAANDHSKLYKTCLSCGATEVPKTKRKCPVCGERIRNVETKTNGASRKEDGRAKNPVEGDVRVLLNRRDDSTYSFKYERSTRKATEYDHLPQHHPKQPPEVNIGEPIFVNPCSYEAVAGVFRQIGRQAGIKRYGGEREWLCIVCDGLPFVMGYQLIERTFVCSTCGASVSGLDERKSHRSEHEDLCTFSLEFDWVLLQPGPGHIEMNMLKTFVRFVWPVFWEGMVEVFNFKSEVAKRSAHNVSDHHKGMALARIARESFAKELVLPYVRQELLKEKSDLSVAGYLKFAMDTVESANYALMFDLTFSILDAIFLYRAGLRCGDTEMMDAGRAQFARMWCARTHPLYRQLAIYDTIVSSCMPPEVDEFTQKTKSLNLTGNPYSGEGADFKLEEVNKSVQHWIPSVPTDKAWKNACANHRDLSKLRDSTMSEINLKDPKEHSSRSKPGLKPEVLAFRTALRQKRFVANHDKESPLISYGEEPLDEDLADFAKKAAAKEAIYLENFIEHHETGGFKRKKTVPYKEAPIFVTPQERLEYYDIRNRSISECAVLINCKIAEIEDDDMRRNLSEAFKVDILSKGKKQDYIDFYELMEEYQNNVAMSDEDPEVNE